jgi:hypothetical protein
MPTHELICPKCHQLDMVQKVSSVHDGGTSYGNFSGSSVGVGIAIASRNSVVVSGTQNLKGRSNTALSIRLSPPNKPTPPDHSIHIVLGILLMAVSVIPALFGIISLLGLLAGSPDIILSTLLLDAILFALCIVPLGGGIAIIYTVLRSENKTKLILEEKINAWEKAVVKWNSLYYCARDDGVFLPGENIFIPTSELSTYLYQ